MVKCVFFSYCLTDQDFFLLQRVSSLSCSCKGTPAQFLLSWSYDPSLTCSQNRLGKQNGPGADDEWLHETTSYQRGGQRRCCLWEEGYKDLYSLRCCETGLIPPSSIWQGRNGIYEGPWSFAVYKMLFRLTFSTPAPALSSQKYLSAAHSNKRNTQSTAKAVAWYKLGYGEVYGVTWQKFGSLCTCP